MLFSSHLIFVLVVKVYSDMESDIPKGFFGNAERYLITEKKEGAKGNLLLPIAPTNTTGIKKDLPKEINRKKDGELDIKKDLPKAIDRKEDIQLDIKKDLPKGTYRKEDIRLEKDLPKAINRKQDIQLDIKKDLPKALDRKEDIQLDIKKDLPKGIYRKEDIQLDIKKDLPKEIGGKKDLQLHVDIKKDLPKEIDRKGDIQLDIKKDLPPEIGGKKDIQLIEKKEVGNEIALSANMSDTKSYKLQEVDEEKGKQFSAQKEGIGKKERPPTAIKTEEVEADNSFPECGFSQVPFVPGNEMKEEDYQKESHLIIGGQTARRGSWPWMVFLEHNKKFYCGGSIITNSWILTAAHCVEPFYKRIHEVTATLGAHVRSEVSFEKRTIPLKRGVFHPEFVSATLVNDIGLFELEKPILFDIHQSIIPVCLPTPNEDVKPGTMTYVMGWGIVIAPNGPPSDILKQAMVPVIEKDTCSEIIKRQKSVLMPQNNTFCTHYEKGGHNSCMGDSGSPLVIGEDNIWVQQGIVSWGMRHCAATTSPSVFTQVSAFIPWIQTITKNAEIHYAEEH